MLTPLQLSLLATLATGLVAEAPLPPAQLLAAHQYTANFEWLANSTNAATVDRMPFDGITIRFKDKTHTHVHSNVSVDETVLRAAMMPIAGKLRNVTANWVAINAGATAPFRDWDKIVLPNYRKLARSARAAGLTGIYLDTEDYGAESGGRCVWWSNKVAGGHMCPDSNPDTWGCSHPPFPGAPACPAMRQCRAEAVAAGKALMTAVIEEWPTARIMTTMGPWLSSNGTKPALNPPTYTFDYHHHPIVGSFCVGLLAGTVGTQARYIDGSEMYYSDESVCASMTLSFWLELVTAVSVDF
jgi:hypothetical protein